MIRKHLVPIPLFLSIILWACQPARSPLPSATLIPTEAAVPTNIPTPPPTINTLETMAEDMTLPHEAAPHGVPASFDWALGPRLGMGNQPGEFQALTAWGQLYEAAEGNLAANTRVQLRNIRAYVLSKKEGT